MVNELPKERMIKACLEGDEGAWKMLVNQYSKRIFNLSYQFSGSYQESEDMTQEIFVKVYNSLSKFDLSKNFDAWLLTLARNQLIDQYRKTKWEKKIRDDYDENHLAANSHSDPLERHQKEETRKFIWDGFNHLSSDTRMAVILRDIQGKKYEEISEIMNLPLGTIKSRINRGRLQLAKVLKNKKEDRDELSQH